MNAARTRVTVISAAVAGAACARWMADPGPEVRVVFDKSHGVGASLATHRDTRVNGMATFVRAAP